LLSRLSSVGDERYGIEDLARLGGVNRRTVRYYVQEGLLPAPEGAGRGAHYGPRHLDRLLKLKSLQEQGLSLDQARERLARPGAAELKHPVRHSYRREWGAHHEPPPPVEDAARSYAAPPAAPRSAWTRIELVPGVEIHVSGDRRLPSPSRLAELAEWCRTHFGDPE
jgi:DNA-binding transcriptional MerR regulator